VKQAALRLKDSTTLCFQRVCTLIQSIFFMFEMLYGRVQSVSLLNCALARMNSHLCLVAQPWSTVQGYVSVPNQQLEAYLLLLAMIFFRLQCLVRFNRKQIAPVSHQAPSCLERIPMEFWEFCLALVLSSPVWQKVLVLFVLHAHQSPILFILNQSVSNKRFYESTRIH
jgi:hypothetical protein